MKNSTTTPKNRHGEPNDMHMGATVLSASTILGDEVCNMQDETLGEIQDVMLDVEEGTIRYAVLASGGFLGMGERMFAIPWTALTLDRENNRFMLDVDVQRLKNAPGFDKDQWPNMADDAWNSRVDSYYAR